MKKYPRFSLVEGLVLFVILGTISSLLPPLLSLGSDSAGLAKCRANLHELGAATYVYASEHDGRLPASADPVIAPSANMDGTFVGDGRMYGALLAEEAGGFGDHAYLSTPHPLICPSLSPTVYEMDPTYRRADEINEDNRIIRMGYVWTYRGPDGAFRFAANDTIYRKPNEPLCFDFGWTHAPGNLGMIIAQPSHDDIMNVLHLGGYVRSVSLEEVNANASSWNFLYFYLRGEMPAP